jgi:hypothetical protein
LLDCRFDFLLSSYFELPGFPVVSVENQMQNQLYC